MLYRCTKIHVEFIVVNIDPAVGCLHRVEEVCVTDVSEEHTVSIIRREVMNY
jgi:hypothetical protein